jgi:hypothetical protein
MAQHPASPAGNPDPGSIDFRGDPTTDPGHLHTDESVTGFVESVVAGDNVTVDSSNPKHPIVSAKGSSGGGGPIKIPISFPGFEGDGFDPYVYPGVTIRLAAGETKTITDADLVNHGPGPGGTVTVRLNGTGIPGMTGIGVTTGTSPVHVTPSDGPVALAEGDFVDMTVTETCYGDWVSGTVTIEATPGA